MLRYLITMALAAMAAQSSLAAIAGEVAGIPVEDSVVMEGGKVVLNGAAWRKRAYFKTDVTAIYLRDKQTSLEGIESAPGPKRLQVTLLKDLPGSVISRYFIADFKAVASDAEFKQLINEISEIGAIYGKIRQVNKGDVVNIDWTPGKGLHSTLNGKQLALDGQPAYINNELMYRLMLRMYVSASGSAELRDNLVGRSRSMIETSTKVAER
jgi:hypothetical protein